VIMGPNSPTISKRTAKRHRQVDLLLAGISPRSAGALTQIWAGLRPVIMIAPALAVMGLLFILPLLKAIELSISSPAGFTFSWYERFFHSAYLWDLCFTIGISFATAAICALVSIPIAFIMVRDFRGKAVANILILFPLVVPHLIGAYALWLSMARSGPVFGLMNNLGILSTAPDLVSDWRGLLIALVWKHFPITALTITAALANIDRTLIEAAQDLGAGWSTRMREIIFPLLMPGVLSGAILVFVMAAAQFSITLVVYSGSRITTIPLGIYHETFGLKNWEFGSALGIGLTAVTLVILGVFTATIRRVYREALDA
jgi:putative spermidine/putrescine transport system permease protein